MTIKALDYDHDGENDEIDVIVKTIPMLVNNDKVKIEENGINSTGWFKFSYRVQNFDSKNTYECSINSVTTSATKPLPTSCTCNESVPNHNSTNQPLAESSSSMPNWALIAVAIALLITVFVTIIIAIWIVRNKSMKRKKTKERNARDHDGEHTVHVWYMYLYSYV